VTRRRRPPLPLAGAVTALVLSAACHPQASNRAQAETAATLPDGPVVTGVTTHFAQGWPPRLLPRAKALGAGMIRDSVHWPTVERTPGTYAFTPANSAHVDRACAAGLKVLLGLEPRNPLYDGGQTVWTPAGQAAFARYARALADRWPGCVTALEIGNEINGKGGMIGPAAQNRIEAHVTLLRAVNAAVKPAHPALALLGGSSNAIPTGFLTRLFRAGALDLVDGIAVHPYRDQPEGVEHELARLAAAMAAAGQVRPIWVTEFSRDFARPQDAAPYYLKSRALMEGAGVRYHLWYALADQPGFPTMGLLRFDGTEKPAGAAFRFAAQTLAPRGPARRIAHGDPALYHYAFGPDAHVVWGAPRTLLVRPGPSGPPRFFRADGTQVADPGTVSDDPLVITGAQALAFGPPQVLADSTYGFAEPSLAWSARSGASAPVPLGWVDWQWNSYLGSPRLPQAAVTPLAMAVAPGLFTLVRWTAKAPGTVYASACFAPRARLAGTVHLAVTSAGQTRWSADLAPARTTAPAIAQVALAVKAGATVDLTVAGSAAGRIAYRWRIAVSPDAPAPCPATPSQGNPAP